MRESGSGPRADRPGPGTQFMFRNQFWIKREGSRVTQPFLLPSLVGIFHLSPQQVLQMFTPMFTEGPGALMTGRTQTRHLSCYFSCCLALGQLVPPLPRSLSSPYFTHDKFVPSASSLALFPFLLTQMCVCMRGRVCVCETGGGREAVECCDVISIHTKASRTHGRSTLPAQLAYAAVEPLPSSRCEYFAQFLPFSRSSAFPLPLSSRTLSPPPPQPSLCMPDAAIRGTRPGFQRLGPSECESFRLPPSAANVAIVSLPTASGGV